MNIKNIRLNTIDFGGFFFFVGSFKSSILVWKTNYNYLFIQLRLWKKNYWKLQLTKKRSKYRVALTCIVYSILQGVYKFWEMDSQYISRIFRRNFEKFPVEILRNFKLCLLFWDKKQYTFNNKIWSHYSIIPLYQRGTLINTSIYPSFDITNSGSYYP